MPSEPPPFGTREFWDANALDPKEEYIEWFAGYEELAASLRCACSAGATVLHAGCGISNLSQALYDDGFRHQVAVDFSEQCMIQQRSLCGAGRPEMGNAVMDCTSLGFRSSSVDVVVDKGTLDALLCIDGGDSGEEAVAQMALEVRRVLRPGGLWVIISFNTPATVVPFVQEAAEADRSSGGGSVTALIACEALHSGNGIIYIFTCKLLPESEESLTEEGAASARRGWLRAVHGRRPDLLAMSRRDCQALDEPPAEAEAEARAELLPPLLALQLLPDAALPPPPPPADAPPPPAAAPPLPPLGAPAHLSRLAVLHLQQQRLTALPASAGALGALTGLRTLDCRRNKLESLPEAVGALVALETLLVDRNALEALPSSLGGLSRLHTLSATHNQLAALPASWRALGALRSLRLQANPLEKAQLTQLAECTKLRLNREPVVAEGAGDVGVEDALCTASIDEAQAQALREALLAGTVTSNGVDSPVS